MLQAKQAFEEVEMIATVTRADGTVEELGCIAYWHRNPLKRMWFKVKQLVKRLYK